jgi:hypothetical protein
VFLISFIRIYYGNPKGFLREENGSENIVSIASG